MCLAVHPPSSLKPALQRSLEKDKAGSRPAKQGSPVLGRQDKGIALHPGVEPSDKGRKLGNNNKPRVQFPTAPLLAAVEIRGQTEAQVNIGSEGEDNRKPLDDVTAKSVTVRRDGRPSTWRGAWIVHAL